jgi:DNA polymerase-3 subunit alpha
MKTTKRSGERWAIVALEDLEGVAEVLVWPKMFKQIGHLLIEDSIVLVKVRIDKRDDEGPRIAALEITTPDIAGAVSGPVKLFIPETRINPSVMDSLKQILITHQGTTEVHLTLVQDESLISLKTDDKLRVSPSPSFFADLKALLGPGCLEAPIKK